MEDILPTCATLAACRAHDGERVRVVGVYTVWDPLPSRAANDPPPQTVILQLQDAEGPYLGAWGRGDLARPLDEIARLRGRTVRVIGTFRATMPPHPTDPPDATSLGGPCIHPIETIDAP